MNDHLNLAGALTRCREGEPSWEPIYDDFVAQLRAVGVGDAAPKVGDRLPEFALPNSRGARVLSRDLTSQGPIVLSFNRGGWCPYCRAELAAWAELIPTLKAAGGRFVAVTGEVGGRAEALRCDVHAEAEVLCDVDHGLALELGLAFHMGADLRRRYLDCGLDLGEIYGTPSWFLPIPATFVLDTWGVVRFAHCDPDFRLRAEPVDLINTISELTHAPH